MIPDELQLSIHVAQLLSYFNRKCVRAAPPPLAGPLTCGFWDKLWIAGLALTLVGVKRFWLWIKLFLHSTHTLKSKVWHCPDRSGIKSLAKIARKNAK